MASTQIVKMIVLILSIIIIQINALPLQSYNSLPIVPYRGRVMADNRDSVISTQPKYFFYPRITDADKPRTDAAEKPMEIAAKPVEKVVQQDKDLLLVPSIKKNTIVNAPLEADVEDVDLVKNLVSAEQVNHNGDVLDVAENNIVFRPLFHYRQQSAQRSRLSRNQDYN